MWIIKIFISFMFLLPSFSVAKSIHKKHHSYSQTKRMQASLKSNNVDELAVLNYFQCYDKIQTEINKCVDNYIHKDVSKANRDHFYSWPLFFEIVLLGFNDCSRNLVKAASAHPNATEIMSCAKVRINNELKDVVFFLRIEKGSKHNSIKLYSIHY